TSLMIASSKQFAESFTSRLTEVVRALDAHIASRDFTDPIARDLAAFWQNKRAESQTLVDRFEVLRQRLRGERLPLVLCHADVYPNNVLIDTEDQFWIVDWDDTLLAPKD